MSWLARIARRAGVASATEGSKEDRSVAPAEPSRFESESFALTEQDPEIEPAISVEQPGGLQGTSSRSSVENESPSAIVPVATSIPFFESTPPASQHITNIGESSNRLFPDERATTHFGENGLDEERAAALPKIEISSVERETIAASLPDSTEGMQEGVKRADHSFLKPTSREDRHPRTLLTPSDEIANAWNMPKVTAPTSSPETSPLRPTPVQVLPEPMAPSTPPEVVIGSITVEVISAPAPARPAAPSPTSRPMLRGTLGEDSPRVFGLGQR